MGKNELSGRDTWQDYSGANAGLAEKSFYVTGHFKTSHSRALQNRPV
jgi:hypothetical protein